MSLAPWRGNYQPGDHIYVFIPYQKLIVVSPDGTKQPYLTAKRKKLVGEPLDIRTDESKGLTFKWLLLQP